MLYKVVQKTKPQAEVPTKHSVPYQSNPSFFIFDIQAVWDPGLSARLPEYQNLAISDGLDWYALNALLAPLLEAVISTTLYNIHLAYTPRQRWRTQQY